LHSWPAGHAAQFRPPFPHEEFDSPESCSQAPAPVQQPAHDPPPQVQAPPEHESPEPHALHAPPAVPHWEVVCEE
jgi:hypothetical protein